VSVVHHRRQLLVRFHPDVAALVLLRPRNLTALFAHELTHSYQGDTRFGHLWYQVALKTSLALLALYSTVLAIVAGIAGVSMIQGHALTRIYSLPMFVLLALGIPYSGGLIAFCFLLRRWMEYSADLSAVLAGHGQEMLALLSLTAHHKQRPWERFAVFSEYPTLQQRVRRLKKYETETGPGDGTLPPKPPREWTRITFWDYFRALFTILIPSNAPMIVMAAAFTQYAQSLARAGYFKVVPF
jgi:hypothetical protein